MSNTDYKKHKNMNFIRFCKEIARVKKEVQILSAFEAYQLCIQLYLKTSCNRLERFYYKTIYRIAARKYHITHISLGLKK